MRRVPAQGAPQKKPVASGPRPPPHQCTGPSPSLSTAYGAVPAVPVLPPALAPCSSATPSLLVPVLAPCLACSSLRI